MSRSPVYTDEERKIIYRIKEEGGTPALISKALRQAGYDRNSRSISSYLYSQAKALPRRAMVLPPTYEVAMDQIEAQRDIIADLERNHYVVRSQAVKATKKVLILTDQHIPYEMDTVMKHAIDNHGDADILVLGGDLMELYSVSKFKKNKVLPFRVEYGIAVEYIKLLSGMFKQVILVSGNHERRLSHYITDRVGNMVKGFIQDDPMFVLSRGLDFGESGYLEPTHHFPNVIYEPKPRGDYIKIGGLIVAHHTNYLQTPMATVTQIALAHLGLEEYQAIVIGHTHAMGVLFWKGKLLIESGCGCGPMEYIFGNGRLAKLPQSFGYTVAYLDDAGNVDLNRTRPYFMGIAHIPKEDTAKFD